MSKSAILLSGGVDSIALAYWKRPSLAITVDYGQRAADAEISAAVQAAASMGIDHEVIRVDCGSLGCGSMSSADRKPPSISPTEEWWPFRNQLLVTLAASLCVQREFRSLLLGTVSTDRQNRDGTPEFFQQMSALTSLQEGSIVVEAPCVNLTSVDLVRISRVPLSILAWSHSCHRGNHPCGQCRGCNKHMAVYREAFPDEFTN